MRGGVNVTFSGFVDWVEWARDLLPVILQSVVRIRYRGPAARASMIAQMLRDEGLDEVTYTPPQEQPGAQSAVEAVVVYFTTKYGDAAAGAAVVKVKERFMRFQQAAELDVEDEGPQS